MIIIKITIILILLISLTACTSSSYKTYKLDIYNMPENLDPQIANSPEADLIIQNTFKGLFKISSQGKIINNMVKYYSKSDDNLKYTFELNENEVWSNGAKVTSNDFEFALKRIFDPNLNSPHKEKFKSIKNAELIIKGEKEIETLGVETSGEHTLIIYLDKKDILLEEKLASTPAMPCNKEFFESTNGRYGLFQNQIISNSDFYINEWIKNDYINLKQNKHYQSTNKNKVKSITFILNTPNQSITDFKNKVTDFLIIDSENYLSQNIRFKNYDNIDNGVWAIAFNLETDLFKEIKNREILFNTLDRSLYKDILPEQHYIANSIIFPYNTMSNNDVMTFDQNNMNIVKIIIEDNVNNSSIFSNVSKSWQEKLNYFFNVELLDKKDFNYKIKNKNFNIALMNFKSKNKNPYHVLKQFVSNNTKNYLGYNSKEYDEIVESILFSKTQTEYDHLIKKASQKLIDDCVVLPIYYNHDYIFYKKSELKEFYNPYTNILDFT